MLVSSTGDVVITNDGGATILHEMSVQHPGGKLVVEVAETQDDEVGDGTTTATVLVGGSLMEEAETLLAQEVHPTIIANGYQLGMEKALSILEDLAIAISADDRENLIKLAGTAMTGKSIEAIKDRISGIVVDAVQQVATETGRGGTYTVDEDDIKIKKQVGDSMDDAELIRGGIVIDKKRVFEQMPDKVTDAKVALLAQPLEITKTQVKSKIKITSSDQLKAFSEQERESLRKLAGQIVAAGANVVLCQKGGIADAVQYYLAKHGVYAVEDVKEEDMKFAARALCGTIVNKPEELTEETLGHAEAAEEVPDADLTIISGCENPKAVTILLRGTSQLLLDELERASTTRPGSSRTPSRTASSSSAADRSRPNSRCASATTPQPSAAGPSLPSKRLRTRSRSSRELSRRTPGSTPSTRSSHSGRLTPTARSTPGSTSTPARSSTC